MFIDLFLCDMKKILLVFIFVFVFVSWCSFEKEDVFLLFEEVSDKFSENMFFLLSWMSSFFEYSNYWINCNTFWDNDNIETNLDIFYSWYVDEDKIEDVYADFYFFDKTNHDQISFSWFMQNIKKSNDYFVNFSGVSIDMWKWNYKSDLWYTIVDNLWGKWIKYEKKDDGKMKSLLDDVNFIFNTIFSSSVFENDWEAKYEWKNVYKIHIKDDILNFLNGRDNIKISKFDWLFIIESENSINMQINDLELFYVDWETSKDIKIKWLLNEKSWNFVLYIDDNVFDVNFKLYKKHINLTILNLKNFENIWEINTNIYRSKKDDVKKYDINWIFTIFHEFFYWSNLENEMKINIRCLYENYNWEDLNLIIQEPDSYILLDQILWDEFSIKNFIY